MSQVLRLRDVTDFDKLSTSRTDWLESGLLSELNHLKLSRLASGERVLDLSMINPDISPPRYILDRLLEASVKSNNHRYSVSRGIRKLRQAFSSLYQSKFDVHLDYESQVCVTMGTKDAIVNTLMVSVEPGQYVLIGEPSYPAYLSACHVANVGICTFEVSTDTSKMINQIQKNLNEYPVKLIILNFPNNPTGITASSDFYQRLAKLVQDRDLVILNDFVYGEMGYTQNPQPSLLASMSTNLRCIESYSLSKAYNIPGWRIAALCGDSEIVSRLSRLKSHIDYGIFLPLQIAASAAITYSGNLVSSTVGEYERRAKVLSDGLRNLGWNVFPPEAGASVWVEIPESYGAKLGSSASRSIEFTKNLLERENVFISPGIVYGNRWDNWVRFALVLPSEQLFEVVRKIENFSRN